MIPNRIVRYFMFLGYALGHGGVDLVFHLSERCYPILFRIPPSTILSETARLLSQKLWRQLITVF